MSSSCTLSRVQQLYTAQAVEFRGGLCVELGVGLGAGIRGGLGVGLGAQIKGGLGFGFMGGLMYVYIILVDKQKLAYLAKPHFCL